MKHLGINELTLPQLKAIPEIARGQHCLVIAPTGTGKTEAALLPIFHRCITERGPGISILYITPLRALNRDMLKRTFYWGKELEISIAVRHGDTPQKERRKQALHPPDMLITTPETLQIMLVGKRLREALSHVRWVIVDEIHELAGDERGAQLAVALERLHECAGEFQRVGLSATIGNPDEVARFLGGRRDVLLIDAMDEKAMEIVVERPSVRDDDHRLAGKLGLDAPSAALLRRIKELIDMHEATLFFVNTRDAAEILAARLREIGADIEVHHGSLSREARIEAEEKFKRGEVKALICTSSLELGIDIGHADFVLQYNSPRQVTRLIQRVGRSGHRKGRVSRAAIVALNPEEYAEAAVIAQKALRGEIEHIRIRKNPLSVLANQIILMTVEYRQIPPEKMYRILTRAYPFLELSKTTFYEVLEQLRGQGVLWMAGGSVRRRKKSTSYFIENISMIPDEKSYDVVDISSNKVIGRLDESFASSHCTPGSRFIMKGRAWEVAKKEERIYVAPASKTYIVPDWAGEEIPVPFAVAREVGALRRKVAEGIVSDDVVKEAVEEQLRGGFELPSDRVITIEKDRNVVYINTHFGTKVNETLSRLVGSLLAQRIGESVAMGSDAYRIYFTLPRSMSTDLLKEILLGIKPDTVEALLRIILKKSSFLHWEALKVARKFGIMEKAAEYDRFSLDRIVNAFAATPFIQEVVEKTIWERMDVVQTAEALRMIERGKIRIVTQPLSPISLEGERVRQEFLKPFGVDATTLRALEKRLGETRMVLVCMNCGHRMHTRVYRAVTSCPKCASKMLAVSKGNIRNDDTRMMKTASLVASHGKKALMVLAGYGIGPDTASRILATQKDGDELLKEILRAEVTYARTRRFWDI